LRLKGANLLGKLDAYGQIVADWQEFNPFFGNEALEGAKKYQKVTRSRWQS